MVWRVIDVDVFGRVLAHPPTDGVLARRAPFVQFVSGMWAFAGEAGHGAPIGGPPPVVPGPGGANVIAAAQGQAGPPPVAVPAWQLPLPLAPDPRLNAAYRCPGTYGRGNPAEAGDVYAATNGAFECRLREENDVDTAWRRRKGTIADHHAGRLQPHSQQHLAVSSGTLCAVLPLFFFRSFSRSLSRFIYFSLYLFCFRCFLFLSLSFRPFPISFFLSVCRSPILSRSLLSFPGLSVIQSIFRHPSL